MERAGLKIRGHRGHPEVHVATIQLETAKDGRQWLHAKSRVDGEVWLAVDPMITLDLSGDRFSV